MTHSFFVYDNLAKTFDLLKKDLTPAQREAYHDGLIELGDKIAAYQAYESNQWAHVISGHLNTFKATGEPRFLRYFEILMDAYVNCTFGRDSKHGLHPTGFFLEEYGPDGNYDHLNMYALVSAYYRYRALPEAKPELVRQMRSGIQRNLYYKSFHWLPAAGNNRDLIFAPNAMNCRTNSLLSIPSYPGDYMAGREFDLGYTRFMMNRPVRPDVAYPASVFPHLANTDAWAMTLIRECLTKRSENTRAEDFSGAWTAELYETDQIPLKAKIVELPWQKARGMWDLPGQIAWKNGSLYGLHFYAVDGANRKMGASRHHERRSPRALDIGTRICPGLHAELAPQRGPRQFRHHLERSVWNLSEWKNRIQRQGTQRFQMASPRFGIRDFGRPSSGERIACLDLYGSGKRREDPGETGCSGASKRLLEPSFPYGEGGLHEDRTARQVCLSARKQCHDGDLAE